MSGEVSKEGPHLKVVSMSHVQFDGGSNCASQSNDQDESKLNSDDDICEFIHDLSSWNDHYYFDSYASLQIHRIMLKDSVRTLTYRDVMYQNAEYFKNKVVLDVGCGTGILSMFAAKAGASKVIGVDYSDIADQAKMVVKSNNLDETITIVKVKLEDVVRLPHRIDKVDVIVSEWMGYCLLYESMLDTILYARDKWLKIDGVILPDKCSLYLTAFEDEGLKTSHLDYWDDVWDFDMKVIRQQASKEGAIKFVDPKHILADPVKLLDLDLYSVHQKDLSIDVSFKLEANRKGFVDGLVVYFDVEFCRVPIKHILKTGPFDPKTHWKQTIFFLDEDKNDDSIMCDKGEEMTGRFALTQNSRNKRDVDFNISFSCNEGRVNQSKVYKLH